MRKLVLALGLIFLVSLLIVPQVLAQITYPDPKGYVNDFANIIPDDVEQKLEATLRDYEAKTTNEIAVVTVLSLQGLTIEDYTIGLAEKWKVGKKDKDNGVILLVAPNERKVRIEVGYGLEPVLTDAKAKLIIEKMIPFFKEGNYASGIELGVNEILNVIGYLTPEEIEAQKREKEAQEKAALAAFGKVVLGIVLFGVFMIVLVIIGKKISAWSKEKKRLALLRESLKTKIPQLEEKRTVLMDNLTRAKERLLQKYSPLNHEPIKNTVLEAETASQKCLSLLSEAKALIEKEPDRAEEKLQEAENLLETIGNLQSKLDELDRLPEDIKTEVAALKNGLERISVEKAIRELALLKQEAPPEIWSEIERRLAKAETSKREIAEFLEEIAKLAFPGVWRFIDARNKLVPVKSLYRTLQETVDAPRKKRQEFRDAKERVGSLKKELENKLQRAEKKAADSDAGGEPKKFLSEVRTKQKEARERESDDPVNWIIVAALLVAAITLANKAYSEADRNIDAANRRRQDDYHRSSTWSSSSGSHGSSFGGFGGGSFGGGGASGGW